LELDAGGEASSGGGLVKGKIGWGEGAPRKSHEAILHAAIGGAAA